MKFNLDFKRYGLGNYIEKKNKFYAGINLRKVKKNKNILTSNHAKSFSLNTSHVLKGITLFKQARRNIKFYTILIKNYRGSRHKRGYPVRGQRTHTNASPKKLKKKNF
jgi:ribosomal protein S13